MARVLITREHASPMDTFLLNVGHQPVHVPLVQLCATGAVMPARKPSAVLVTSKAVVRFVPRIGSLLKGVRTSAVGQATADALEQVGVRVQMVGDGGGLEALERLEVGTGEAVWFVGAMEPSGPLLEAIERRGVHHWGVYTNVVPDGAPMALRSSEFDAITFASSSAVRAFTSVLGPTDRPVFAIGATTASEARSAGFREVTVATDHSLEALARATARVPR